MSTILFGGLETRLIYYPMKLEQKPLWVDIEEDPEEIYFHSNDGVKLNAWYIKADQGKPTVIYCNGQAENITFAQNILKTLSDRGYGVFLFDYRGHGKSKGKPYETGLYLDLESAIKYLKTTENIPENEMILWGRSLGGAVVADVASRSGNIFKGVILESTFTNIRQVAVHLTTNGILEGKIGFWSWLSNSFVTLMPVTQKFATDTKIHRIETPLLIGHSVHDTTIPVEMAHKLKSLNNSAELYVSERGSHFDSDWFFPKALDFIKSLDSPTLQDQVLSSEHL